MEVDQVPVDQADPAGDPVDSAAGVPIVPDPVQDGQMEDEEEAKPTQPNPNGFFADTGNQAACSVRVALRVRPLIKKELFEKQIVRAFEDNNTVTIGGEKLFTFDACFGQQSHQEDVFDRCVKNLVLGCFLGYNATVLAYGQTGSGKTWTMGSGYTSGLTEDEFGIIPRVIRLIFEEVEKRKGKTEFIIKCSFLEIYNEELNDLLDANGLQQALATGERSNKINIREEKNGSISVYGLHEEKVDNAEELATCLDKGSNFRTTASTLMNNNSSRSHAIFTITIEQHQIDDLYQVNGDKQEAPREKNTADEFMVAKFHFVDLAGSERAKKTGAVGAQLKEGININKSLLVLGNVISALSDEGKKGNFIPYRDSKLTRILQDSLGGNSRTTMIACCSPAESNFDETLNTLNYASRARKIKNKPKINRDPNSALIAELRQQCYEIQKECLSFRRLLVSNGIEFKSNLELPSEEEMAAKDLELAAGNQLGGGQKAITTGGGSGFGMSGAEIRELEDQIKKLKIENSSKSKQIQSLNVANQGLQAQLNAEKIETFSVQQSRDAMRVQIDQVNAIMEKMGVKAEVYEELTKQLKQQSKLAQGDEDEHQPNGHPDSEHEEEEPVIIGLGGTLVEEYQQKLQELKKQMDEKELLLAQLQNDTDGLLRQSDRDQKVLEKQAQEIEKFKRNAAKLQKENTNLQNEQRNLQKQLKSSNNGGGAGKSNTRNTTANHGNNAGSDPFRHSFKRSFNMTNRQKEITGIDRIKKADQFAEDLEENLNLNLKKLNDKFMETLTSSLTKQLGFDLSEAVENQRKQTIGSSFIEKKSDGLLGLQFGKKEKGNANTTSRESSPQGLNPFGPQNPIGSRGAMAASVVVTGSTNNRKPLIGSALEPMNGLRVGLIGNDALSAIDDAITANEQDTVQDEKVDSDDGNQDMHKQGAAEVEDVSDEAIEPGCEGDDKFKISVLTHEEQTELLKKSIAKRASMLEAEEARKSQLEAAQAINKPENAQADVEMTHSPEKSLQQAEEQYANMNMESACKPIVVDVSDGDDDLVDEEELRDEADEELFAALETRDHEDINEKRAEHNSVLVRLDGTLKDKEELLVAIKESQAQMQTDLISLMKEQYQHQVLELTNEITLLEKQKADNLSKPGKALSQQQRKQMEDQFKQKQRELEKQLKEAKEKNKQQQAVKKQVDTQNAKIRTLETEIQKIKVQKTSAQKKFKEQTDKYNILRKQRADELLKMKKASLKKDKEIEKLKKDAKRKEVLNKRRQEEIKVLQTQKNMVTTKKANASKMRKAKLEIDTSKIKDWIRISIDKMIEIADAEQEIKTQTSELKDVEDEIEQESNHKASLQLLKEKMLVKKYVIEGQPDEEQDLEALDNIDLEIEKIDLEIDQYQQNINSLSEKQDYVNTKISEVSKEIVQINMDVAGSLGKQNLQSPEGVKALIDCFFQILQEASVQLRQLQIEHEKEICAFEQLKEDYQQQSAILEANEKYFHAKMQNIENEFQQKEVLLNQLIEETKQDQEEKQNNQGGSQAAQAPKNMQRILTAKEEVQKSKDSAINESKMFLSKRLAELEKQNIELEKHNFNLQNKLNFALSDKEQLKLSISSLKNQLRMTNEISGDINLRSHIQQQYGIQGGQASHAGKEMHHLQGQNQNGTAQVKAGSTAGAQHHLPANRRIPSLAERRADLKGLKNARKEGGADPKLERVGSAQYLNTDPSGASQQQHGIAPGAKKDRPNIVTEDPRVIPVEDDDDGRLSSRMSLGDGEDEDVAVASVSGDQELGKLKNSSFAHKYSTVAGKKPPKELNDIPDQCEALEAYQTRPRTGTVADKSSIALKQKAIPYGTNKTQAQITPRQPLNSSQNASGTKKSGGVFARLTNRKPSNYESNLKRKLGMKQSDSQGAFAGRKQSSASIKQSPGAAASITFSQGKVNETIYSNRSHYNTNEAQVEASDLLDGPQNVAPYVQPATGGFAQDPPQAMHNWGVELVVDQAHNQQIYDIATVGNMLYSTSLKNLKIWDVNTMQLVSDIKAHSGVIKCVKTMYTHSNGETVGDRIFVTAGDKSDKTIQIWDMTTITNMTSLKGHKGEIRALEFSKDGKYLFSAGQGGMFVWDLRNTDSPIEVIEKREDIFALKSTQKQLFMGCRNHSIVPMGLGYHAPFHEQVQAPLKQPHLDVVTSFASLLDERILISASKDRNLRGWSTGQSQDESLQPTVKQVQNLSVNQAHSGDINVLESSHEQREMYSGSKDGIVHIWNLRDGSQQYQESQDSEERVQSMTLQQVGSLRGQGSAVTAIAALDASFGRVIIYGSMDKSLRICKRHDTLDHHDQLGDCPEFADFPPNDDEFLDDHYLGRSAGMEQYEQVENTRPSKQVKDAKTAAKKSSTKTSLSLNFEGIHRK